MGVVQDKNGNWTYRSTKDCFGDSRTSFYYWETKAAAERAENDMLLRSLKVKDFNERKHQTKEAEDDRPTETM